MEEVAYRFYSESPSFLPPQCNPWRQVIFPYQGNEDDLVKDLRGDTFREIVALCSDRSGVVHHLLCTLSNRTLIK